MPRRYPHRQPVLPDNPVHWRGKGAGRDGAAGRQPLCPARAYRAERLLFQFQGPATVPVQDIDTASKGASSFLSVLLFLARTLLARCGGVRTLKTLLKIW